MSRDSVFRSGLVALLVLVLVALTAPTARAQELLSNRSFETPVGAANGNNFFATIPNWTIINVTPASAQPYNIVRPFAGYAGNPTATPAGGGAQYLDINSAGGTIRQTVTVPSTGLVDMSAFFAVRDGQRALGPLTIRLLNGGGTTVATASVSFAATEAVGLWKQAVNANIPVTAGTYTFEADIDNFANFDLASIVFKPALAIAKTSAPFSDPFNGTTNPKHIPAGVAQYTITATSPASYAVTANTIFLTDATPVNSDLVVTDIGAVGSGPAAFVAGTTGLTYTFTSLASTTDDIEFSNNGGTSFAYTPAANANGVDPAVTTVRLRPKGTMAASSTLTFRLRYRVR